MNKIIILVLTLIISTNTKAELIEYEVGGVVGGLGTLGSSAIFKYEEIFDGQANSSNLLSITGDFGSGLVEYFFSTTTQTNHFNYDLITGDFISNVGQGNVQTNLAGVNNIRYFNIDTQSVIITNLHTTELFRYVMSGAINIATAVPEPTTLAIFALGIMGLASRRFNKRS
jgi:hypothetical protein